MPMESPLGLTSCGIKSEYAYGRHVVAYYMSKITAVFYAMKSYYIEQTYVLILFGINDYNARNHQKNYYCLVLQ